jgi:hypothetical protein
LKRHRFFCGRTFYVTRDRLLSHVAALVILQHAIRFLSRLWFVIGLGLPFLDSIQETVAGIRISVGLPEFAFITIISDFDNVLPVGMADKLDLAGICLIPLVKGGKPHAVPLTKRAMEIIEARRQYADSEWVFPSQREGERASKSGHIQEPKAAWKRVTDAAGLDDVTLHDLRRTLASHMAIHGTSEAIIAKMLGHSSQSVTGIYARLNTEAVRDAMESAQDAMFVGTAQST